MRAAPAVVFPLARSGFWRAGASLLAALAGAAVAAWASSWQQAGAMSSGLFCLACALVGGGLGWRFSLAPEARLHWDGEGWSLEVGRGALQPGEPQISLDGGHWILLRWHTRPGGWRRLAPRCLPLARQDHPLRWHALRVALHAGLARGAGS